LDWLNRYFADKEALFSELIKQTVSGDSAGFQNWCRCLDKQENVLPTLISSIVVARRQREALEAHRLLNHALDAGAMPEEMRELLGRPLSNAA